MKKITALFLSGFFLASTGVFGQEVETAGDYGREVVTKVGRGLENVITSPAEIPCTMEKEMRSGDRIYGFFEGFGKGTVFFLRRALVGVTEVGTFMIPMERTIPRVCVDSSSAAAPQPQAGTTV